MSGTDWIAALHCMMTTHYGWILWGVLAFLILNELPRPAVTALSPWRRFSHSITPIVAAVATVSLSGLLGLILYTRSPLPMTSSILMFTPALIGLFVVPSLLLLAIFPNTPDGKTFITLYGSRPPAITALSVIIVVVMATTGWAGLLILLTATGIGLIPVLFQARLVHGPVSMKRLSQVMTGLAWASCWPATHQAAREGNPIPFLLGAVCALLPDTLDRWTTGLLDRPDIHIVPPPESPAPHEIAEALVMGISHCHKTGKALEMECYPVPIDVKRWRSYRLHFDSIRRKVGVSFDDNEVPGVMLAAPVPFVSDPTSTLAIHNAPLSLRAEPKVDGRVAITVTSAGRQWSHSLVMAGGLGAIAGGLWGVTAGVVAGGAMALQGFINQWGFTGTNLFWPFTHKHSPGWQWVQPGHDGFVDFALFWMALLLLGWNLLRMTTPPVEGPPLIQVLLFGGAIPLTLWRLIRQLS